MDRPPQPPEGLLLQRARDRRHLSQRAAARKAGMSDGRWRHIESGYQTVSAGVHAAVRAPAGTLARMAASLGVTAAELIDAGREDAAKELATVASPAVAGREPSVEQLAAYLAALPEDDADLVVGRARRRADEMRRNAIRPQPSSPDTRRAG